MAGERKNFFPLGQSYVASTMKCFFCCNHKMNIALCISLSPMAISKSLYYLQLRNLLWATSKHDVYMMQNYSIMHWSSLLRRSKEVLNVAGQIVPTQVCNYLLSESLILITSSLDQPSGSLQKPRGSSAQSLSRVQISTMAVKDNFIVAGGFHGELICKVYN